MYLLITQHNTIQYRFLCCGNIILRHSIYAYMLQEAIVLYLKIKTSVVVQKLEIISDHIRSVITHTHRVFKKSLQTSGLCNTGQSQDKSKL